METNIIQDLNEFVEVHHKLKNKEGGLTFFYPDKNVVKPLSAWREATKRIKEQHHSISGVNTTWGEGFVVSQRITPTVRKIRAKSGLSYTIGTYKTMYSINSITLKDNETWAVDPNSLADIQELVKDAPVVEAKRGGNVLVPSSRKFGGYKLYACDEGGLSPVLYAIDRKGVWYELGTHTTITRTFKVDFQHPTAELGSTRTTKVRGASFLDRSQPKSYTLTDIKSLLKYLTKKAAGEKIPANLKKWEDMELSDEDLEEFAKCDHFEHKIQ